MRRLAVMQARIRAVAAGLWVAACGPLPPAIDTAGSETSATTGDPSTGGPTEPTTGPTTATSETSGTTGPVPECQSDADCDGYCSYCIDGECSDEVGCCGLMPNPEGELELRCIGYECYGDDDCAPGYFCDSFGFGGFCTPEAAIPVCDRQPLMLSQIPLQDRPSAIALADLDGDGRLDLVAVLPTPGVVEVALGDGMGGFAASATFPTGLTAEPQRVAVADFDLDGSPDLALTGSALAGELSLLFGQDAVFAAPVQDTIGVYPHRVWAGDFDGDGAPDVLVDGGEIVGELTLRLGDGMGGLGPPTSLVGPDFVPIAHDVGAVTGDDRLDIARTGTDVPAVDVVQYEAGGFQVLVSVGGSGTTQFGAVAVGDVSGDGLGDLVGHRVVNGVELIQPWPSLVNAAELVVDGPVQLGPIADVDGDERGDLVTVGTSAVRVIYLDAPCIEAYALPAVTAAPLLAAGDLDGDGKRDVVAGSAEGASASVLRSGP